MQRHRPRITGKTSGRMLASSGGRVKQISIINRHFSAILRPPKVHTMVENRDSRLASVPKHRSRRHILAKVGRKGGEIDGLPGGLPAQVFS